MAAEPFEIVTIDNDPSGFLRTEAVPVAVGDNIRSLAKRMIATIDHVQETHGGVVMGLAANQIGVLQRVIVVRIDGILGDPESVDFTTDETAKLVVMINPKIIKSSEETVQSVEGCLSIPEKHYEITRAKRITVQYTTLEGDTEEQVFEGYNACFIKHEIDHLNGILLPDEGEAV